MPLREYYCWYAIDTKTWYAGHQIQLLYNELWLTYRQPGHGDRWTNLNNCVGPYTAKSCTQALQTNMVANRLLDRVSWHELL